MLVRLKVSGFKNLMGTNVYFGPFTCIAGPNGSGKSNIFDAITFLSALSNDTLINAASHVRDEKGRTSNIRQLFHRVGDDYDDVMTFEADMIIPGQGFDDLGQPALAKITFLTYELHLGYKKPEDDTLPGQLEIRKEELRHIKITEASRRIRFPKSAAWLKSVVYGRSTSSFISTDKSGSSVKIRLHQDHKKGEGRYGGGKPREFLASSLPRTVLSNTNAAESPTALLARREMESWKILQLEPSALREPDEYDAPSSLDYKGSHLPSTLFHLARQKRDSSQGLIYEKVSNSLRQLLNDVQEIRVDADPKRQIYTLEVSDKNSTYYPARSLSDGTLRFLALSVIKEDPNAIGLICLEEPENGIHPDRIPAMIQLLRAIAVDTDESVNEDNPLRQVIINTHSPTVVSCIPTDSLLLVQFEKEVISDKIYDKATFKWLKDTWRTQNNPEITTIVPGKLLAYLDPIPMSDIKYKTGDGDDRRVADLPEFQMRFNEEL